MPVWCIKSIVSLSEHPERFAMQGLELGARNASVVILIVVGIVLGLGDDVFFRDSVILVLVVILVVILRIVIMVNKVTGQTSSMCNQVRRIRIGF